MLFNFSLSIRGFQNKIIDAQPKFHVYRSQDDLSSKVERQTFTSSTDVCMDEKTNKILSIDFQWLLAIAPIPYEAQCTNHDIVSE